MTGCMFCAAAVSRETYVIEAESFDWAEPVAATVVLDTTLPQTVGALFAAHQDSALTC